MKKIKTTNNWYNRWAGKRFWDKSKDCFTSAYSFPASSQKHQFSRKCQSFFQSTLWILFLSFFWSVFSRIRTEYGEIQSISPYSVQMRENTDQKKLRIWTLFTQCEVFKSYGWKLNKEYSYSKTQKYLSLFHVSYKLQSRI